MAPKEIISLGEIPALAAHINTMSAASAKLLHQFIYENDDGRKNRRNLRKFTGFEFEKDSDKYVEKFNNIKEVYLEKDLILICTIFGLNSGETKEETIEMILTYLMDLKLLMNKEDDDDNEDDDDDDNSKDDNEDDDNKDDNEDDDDYDDDEEENKNENMENKRSSTRRYLVEKTQKTMNRCTIDFKDVEDAIRIFDGKANYAIENWIEDFEDLSKLLGWNELQKFIFGKKSLKGLARLYIQSEKNIVSWKKLKEALLAEFGEKMSVVDLHKTLQRRKMKDNEDVYEYFLVMKELASRGSIDNGSLIQYVIEGIQDTHINKMMLYGSKNIKDFKEKLQHYKAYSAEYNRTSKPKQALAVRHPNQKLTNNNRVVEQRCYSCGKIGHKANECDKKDLGTKCFRCNKFGHK